MALVGVALVLGIYVATALYLLTRDLADAGSVDEMSQRLVAQISREFECTVALSLRDAERVQRVLDDVRPLVADARWRVDAKFEFTFVIHRVRLDHDKSKDKTKASQSESGLECEAFAV